MAHITKCSRCGSTEFFVHESYVWNATVDDDGLLGCTNADSTIDTITCVECPAEYGADDFVSLDFN